MCVPSCVPVCTRAHERECMSVCVKVGGRMDEDPKRNQWKNKYSTSKQ